MKCKSLERWLYIIFTIAVGFGCNQTGAAKEEISKEAVTTPVSERTQTSAYATFDPNIFVNLAKSVVPSVVNISTAKVVRSPFTQGLPDDVFRRYFEDFFGPGLEGSPFPRGMPRNRGDAGRNNRALPMAVSLGTGFIVDSSGLILTNNHVVADADEIKIAFSESRDELPTDGQVVGRDPELDVALIQVKTKRQLVPLVLGDSDALQVGEYVMAVGNPFGHGHSVSHGIVSAKERAVPGLGGGLANYLQTDTPINPGNSGGPLVNLRGEVIGINNAIQANAQGIGFAIPARTVQKILPQLKKNGSVDRGYIGALIGELTPELAQQLKVPPDTRAPMVTGVSPNGPAEEAGIKPYDVVLAVNGKSVKSAAELVGAITSIGVGEKANIKLLRDGKEKSLPVTVAKRPSDADEISIKKSLSRSAEQVDPGMEVVTLTPQLAKRYGIPTTTKGVLVSSVDPEGPANRVGLTAGDVILEVDRKPVPDENSFQELVKERKSYLIRMLRMNAGQKVFGVIILDLK